MSTRISASIRAPRVEANSDGNEATSPSTANVWAEHSVWPQDPGFRTALAGGITSLQILPGSANLIGGRSVVLKNVPSVTYQGMKFPGAPQGLKMACGENPKRVYGEDKHDSPPRAWATSRAIGRSGPRRRNTCAIMQEYQQKLAAGKDAKDAKPPKRDLRLDTLAAALKGDILVHMHCYRADEMATVLDMSKEFGYHVAAFHHAVEAYKIADLLAEQRRVRGDVGRLVGLQDGGLRRHSGEHRLRRCRAGTAAPSCIPIRRKAFNVSTRRPPRPSPTARAPVSIFRPSAPFAG